MPRCQNGALERATGVRARHHLDHSAHATHSHIHACANAPQSSLEAPPRRGTRTSGWRSSQQRFPARSELTGTLSAPLALQQGVHDKQQRWQTVCRLLLAGHVRCTNTPAPSAALHCLACFPGAHPTGYRGDSISRSSRVGAIHTK
eukprot:364741-Chlamydomonas_euryale.AAC.25